MEATQDFLLTTKLSVPLCVAGIPGPDAQSGTAIKHWLNVNHGILFYIAFKQSKHPFIMELPVLIEALVQETLLLKTQLL